MHWVKQAPAWFLLLNPSEWWMVFINKTWNIFIMNTWKIASTQSASQTEEMARYQGVRLVILLVTHVSWLSHVSSQDVADCTWQPSADDADAGKSELECNLKTLQTGPAVIPQVNYFMTQFLPSQVSTQIFVCWFSFSDSLETQLKSQPPLSEFMLNFFFVTPRSVWD